ncbi:MAG: DUF4433 domain-containing protein, partial [SAR324 cluster bacterium]|nr:DUF4433 domain-containing protein [SAR324 cluster bacterium]
LTKRTDVVNMMESNGLQYKNIAHSTIQDKRANTKVPCGPGGCLHDYIPFYLVAIR